MSASAGSPLGAFPAHLRNDELGEAVVASPATVSPRRPETVSQRRVDSTRASAGHPELISALAITLRLSADAYVHRSCDQWLADLVDDTRDGHCRSRS